jgi:hypothetical protein
MNPESTRSAAKWLDDSSALANSLGRDDEARKTHSPHLTLAQDRIDQRLKCRRSTSPQSMPRDAVERKRAEA